MALSTPISQLLFLTLAIKLTSNKKNDNVKAIVATTLLNN